MPDARDTARTWLAGTLHGAQCACAFRDGRCVAYGAVHRALADAILSAPGVEVEETGIVVDWDSHPVMVRKRVVVKLPWGEPTEEAT